MTVQSQTEFAKDFTSQQKLFAAVSIIQSHILAEDTALNADRLFGNYHMPMPALEVAERLLIDIAPDLET